MGDKAEMEHDAHQYYARNGPVPCPGTSSVYGINHITEPGEPVAA